MLRWQQLFNELIFVISSSELFWKFCEIIVSNHWFSDLCSDVLVLFWTNTDGNCVRWKMPSIQIWHLKSLLCLIHWGLWMALWVHKCFMHSSRQKRWITDPADSEEHWAVMVVVVELCFLSIVDLLILQLHSFYRTIVHFLLETSTAK